ncbi:hypothetical protein Q1695_011024 [Nippostrongylus brasiliensis]|nr:hypothetical protein Q1695_011024 [Nippostrongylus brasiliensis]
MSMADEQEMLDCVFSTFYTIYSIIAIILNSFLLGLILFVKQTSLKEYRILLANSTCILLLMSVLNLYLQLRFVIAGDAWGYIALGPARFVDLPNFNMFCAILLVTLDDYSFVTIAMCMVFKYHTLIGKTYSMWQIFTAVILFSLLPLSPGIALLIHNPDYEQLHKVLERLRPEDELRRYGEYCGLPDVKNAFVLYLVLVICSIAGASYVVMVATGFKIRRYALSSYNKMSPQSSHAFDMMIKALVIQSFVPVFIWLPSKILYLLTQFTSFHSVFVEYLLLALSPLLAVSEFPRFAECLDILPHSYNHRRSAGGFVVVTNSGFKPSMIIQVVLPLVVFARLAATNSTLRIVVLIFGEHNFDDHLHSVKNAYVEIFESEFTKLSNYTVVPEYINGGALRDRPSANRLQLTDEVVCEQVMNRTIAVVIYAPLLSRETTPEYLSRVSSTAYALGFYSVPTIGVMVREAEFSKKKIYPTFVRTTPSYADESYVFLNLLRRLDYRQVVVVCVKGDRNGEQFVELFEKKRMKYKVHVQSYITVEINDSLNTSLPSSFEEVTSNIVVLYATKLHAQLIFAAAFELTQTNKVWLVNEDASKARNVPNGAIANRLSATPLSALRSSFASIRNGLTFLDSLSVPINPPTECAKDAALSTWLNDHGPALLKAICSTSTSKIMFNEQCERVSVDYDILNYNEGYKEVGVLHGADLRLSEETIYWPGNGAKPLEISLPKHLRAVTVHDPPFVYTHPIISLAECKNLGVVSIELSAVNTVKVEGPWYPCPKYGQNYTYHYCCAGYAIDLLFFHPNNTIDTSFTFSLHLNDSYGAVVLGEKGYVLTGALGELDSDHADLAIGGMTINPERERYIDFSEPWLYHGIRILEKSIPRDSPMQSFLQPLKSSLWTSLFISVITVGLVIFCLDLKSPFDRFYRSDRFADAPPLFLEEVENERVNFGEAMWFVWGVLLNSGVSEKTPRSCAARVLGIVWCGFCMIMVASYTANLAAFLVLDQPVKGLTGITDPKLRNPSANYSFGTVLNSNVYQYFKRHVELSTMFRKMEAHNMEKVSDALSSLINGSLDAFIWDSTRLDFEAARHCQLRTRGALFGRSAYGVGLQKNSPWTPHITSAILRMAESGVIENLDTKWIENKESKCVADAHKSPARLSLWNMRDVFILVTGGVAAGALFSAIEVVYGRRKARLGRERALAARYVQKWRARTSGGVPANKYNLSRPVIRRGFAGLEPCTLADIRQREMNRSRQKFDDGSLHPATFYPDLNFSRHPTVLFCSRCRNLIETDVHRECGMFAYVWCMLFVLMFLWPCSPLPCFMETFSDFVHICPVCSHKIGRYRRCRRSQFYV